MASSITNPSADNVKTATDVYNAIIAAKADLEKAGKMALTTQLDALGTAQTVYVVAPVAGVISNVDAVSSGAGDTATATITVSDGADAAVGTCAFVAAYVAGTKVSASSLANTTVTAGEVLKVVTDGGGGGTGSVTVTITVDTV